MLFLTSVDDFVLLCFDSRVNELARQLPRAGEKTVGLAKLYLWLHNVRLDRVNPSVILCAVEFRAFRDFFCLGPCTRIYMWTPIHPSEWDT